jgi:hypothetical protein
MNLRNHHPPYPDVATVPSELKLNDRWEAEAVAGLIRSKCNHVESPAFLFLGRKEAALLTAHLASAFGEEAVVTLHDTYYMGLDLITVDCESFLATGGRKVVRTLQDPISRRPAWRESDDDASWQLRI